MTTEYLIRLPWPPAKTSKNGSQADFQGKARAAKSYKAQCAWACIAQAVRKLNPAPVGNIAVTITYHPPKGGRVDWDNMAARAKQGFDAVSEAIGVDDGRWWPVISDKGDPVPGGAVVVHVNSAEAGQWQAIGDIAKSMIKGTVA
ncbi:hypothetical protein [Roseovarius mucosus]|uniref:hypothetical protein n=1 Tax=Roseovarius mucosus TaxID=215743 RepID=UPI0035CF94C9